MKASEDQSEPTGDDDGQTTTEGTEPSARRPGTAMERKVLNDSISRTSARSPNAHGRNAEWAEKAVRDAATLTSEAALDENVIDVISPNRQALLADIDGFVVNINDATATLDTNGLTIVPQEPGWRTKFLSTIANPQIALLLLLVGVYGLLFEGYNPGAVVPGVVGVVCLLLAAYALTGDSRELRGTRAHRRRRNSHRGGGVRAEFRRARAWRHRRVRRSARSSCSTAAFPDSASRFRLS